MKKLMFSAAVALLGTSLVFNACKKDDEIKGVGNLHIEMDNRFGSDDFQFGKAFVTPSGDTVTFSTFNYYVSNFVLVKSDGTEYVVPKDSCYFLCLHDDAESRELTLRNVPAGDYKSIRFTVGVDSLKSVSPVGERTGVLDPTGAAAGMYWSWNSGYIFMKLEGLSPQAPVNAFTNERTVQYHVGLFGGKDSPTLNNLRTITLTSADELGEVREGKEGPDFHVFVDAKEIFSSPTAFKIFDHPTSHGDPFSKTLADNYKDMFILDHVHNE